MISPLCEGPGVYRLSSAEYLLLQALENEHRVFNGPPARWVAGKLCRENRMGDWEPALVNGAAADRARLAEIAAAGA